MMASYENAEQPATVGLRNNDPKNQQRAQTAGSGNPNTTSVSVLSPQKHDHLPGDPENPLGSLAKKSSSNPSSRSSRKRLEMEAENLEDEANTKVEKKTDGDIAPTKTEGNRISG